MLTDRKNNTADEKEIINVIDEFDYSTQSDEYNGEFRNWRKKLSNPYTYNYSKNVKEQTFVDGQGFVSTSPQDSEKEVIYRVFQILGNVLLIYLFIEIVFEKAAIAVLDCLGLNIHNSYINNSIYGGQTEVLIILTVMTLFKYALPIFILHSKIKIPNNVRFPMDKSRKNEFFNAFSAAMIVSVISSISRAYSNQSKEIYDYFSSFSKNFQLKGDYELIVYVIFDVVVVSILNEILFRGDIFHALRQFGDLFAVVTTALISTLITHDFSYMFGSFLIAMVSGIFVLRSGNFFMAIMVRIIHKLYLFGLILIESSSNEYMFLTKGFYMSVIFAFGVIIFLVKASVKPNELVTKKNLHTYISTAEKVKTGFHSMSMAGTVFICVITALWEIVL